MVNSFTKRFFIFVASLLISSIGIASTFSVGAYAFYASFDTLRTAARSYFDFNKSKTTIFTHTTFNDSVSNNPVERFFISSISTDEDAVFHFFLFGVPSGSDVIIYQCAICFKSSTINNNGVIFNASNSTLTAYTCQPGNGYYPYIFRYGTVASNGSATFAYRGQSTSDSLIVVNGALYNYDIRRIVNVPASKLSSFQYTTYSSNNNTDSSIVNPSLSWQDYVESDPALSSYFDDHFSNATDLEDYASSDQDFDTEEESSTDSDNSTTNSKDNPLSPDYTGQWTNGNSEPVNDFSSVNNNDLYSKIDSLISGVDMASSLMESNLSEMSDNFSNVNNTLSSIFSVFPPVIIGLIVCAVLMLICIKVLGR